MVCSVDVGLFSKAPLPYVAYDGLRLPFADATFDTTLVLLTLHHCAAPEPVLDEALRVTRQRLRSTSSERPPDPGPVERALGRIRSRLRRAHTLRACLRRWPAWRASMDSAERPKMSGTGHPSRPA